MQTLKTKSEECLNSTNQSSMTSQKYLKDLPKAIYLWLKFKIIKILLDFRNRPLPILKYPDKRLKRIAVPVDFEKTTIEERTTLVRKVGLALAKQNYGNHEGIAAPQVGINLRIIIVRGNVMFNPEWQPTKAPPEVAMEGCYSVPNKVFKVLRAKYGWAKWTNIEGRPMADRLNGLPAIIFQHELDHLNGLCCLDTGEEIKVESRRASQD